jgi:hypothetical protein
MNEPIDTPEQEGEARRRSIRQIPIPENRRLRRTSAKRPDGSFVEEAADEPLVPAASMADDVRRREPEYAMAATEEEEEEVEQPARYRDGYFAQKGKRRSGWKWAVGIIALLAILAGASLFFKSATINVSARQLVTSAPTTLELKNGEGYKAVSATIVERETVAATTESAVERKASGSVTIYNDFNNESQELIATTRFETESGLIFRIPDGIVVPGNTMQGGKTIPGRAEAVVVADKAGAEYNVGPTKFSIPGFEGTPKFTAFWADSTQAMSGGLVGTVKTITEAEQEAAVARLRTKIEARIQEELKKAAGENSLVLGVPPTVSFSEPKVSEANGQVTVEVTATVNGYAADESQLAKMLVSANNGKTPSANATLEFAGGMPAIEAALAEDVITATVPAAVVVWQVDTQAIAKAAAGRSKKEVGQIASGFEAVETMKATVKPNWAGSFPQKTEKIEVIVD